MLDKLWVKEREAGELILVEVHHEQLVCGGELHSLARELTVKVGHVLAMSLQQKNFRAFDHLTLPTYNLRFEGRLDLTGLQLVPVNPTEK